MGFAIAWALAVLFVAFDAAAAGPRQILVLHSFGRDFAPYDTITSVFRTDLARRSKEPVTFIDANLDFSHSPSASEERSFIDYLRTRFAGAAPDVLVTIGPPAALFYLQHRDELFPGTPLVIGSLDERFVQRLAVGPADAVVAGKVDLPGLVENILRLLPDTRTISVVIGASELEHIWKGELQREFAPFAGRVSFEWLDGLSLAQMQAHVAQLPPHSALLYAYMIVDAAGVPHERQAGLESLHATANAPIFGLYENEIGKGVVGGPYSSQRRRGEHLATAALQMLGGTVQSPQPRIDMTGFETPVYDWRELDRWSIPPGRLPPDSQLRFKPPSIWVQHRVAVLATAIALVIQAALIAALLIQRIERRKAERESQHLGGRILTAQEDERRRIAREMHDDVTQRLAAIAIDAAKAQGNAGSSAAAGALNAIRQRLVKLSEDVHALSYRLHPSVLEDLGLVAALQAECGRVARQEPIQVEFESDAVPKKVPSNAAICIFRVAQEALRNVVRHAEASHVAVSLRATEGGIALAVHDDGTGLAASRDNARTSLGLVSMQERVRLVGGRLEIASRPEHGTSVVAWVPLQEAH
jgi:signal transduction histidine kinase